MKIETKFDVDQSVHFTGFNVEGIGKVNSIHIEVCGPVVLIHYDIVDQNRNYHLVAESDLKAMDDEKSKRQHQPSTPLHTG